MDNIEKDVVLSYILDALKEIEIEERSFANAGIFIEIFAENASTHLRDCIRKVIGMPSPQLCFTIVDDYIEGKIEIDKAINNLMNLS